MSFESCGVLPLIVTDLTEAREELQTSGAVIFERIDCTEAGTRAFASCCRYYRNLKKAMENSFDEATTESSICQ